MRNAQTSAALLEVRDDWLVGIASQDIHHCDWLKMFHHSHIANSDPPPDAAVDSDCEMKS